MIKQRPNLKKIKNAKQQCKRFFKIKQKQNNIGKIKDKQKIFIKKETNTYKYKLSCR